VSASPWLLSSAVLLAAVLVGCGPNPRLLAADDTLMVALSAIDESNQLIETAEGGEPAPAVEDARRAHDRARVRVDEAQSITQTWRDTGSGELAWVTLSPCLAASLIGLRMTMEAARLAIPEDLPQAEAMAAEPAGDECASEPRPQITQTTETAETATDSETAPSGPPAPPN
jgi:hypothetical protein